jgi:hypothetical protein
MEEWFILASRIGQFNQTESKQKIWTWSQVSIINHLPVYFLQDIKNLITIRWAATICLFTLWARLVWEKYSRKIFLKRGTMNWKFSFKKVCSCIFWFSQRIFSKHFIICTWKIRLLIIMLSENYSCISIWFLRALWPHFLQHCSQSRHFSTWKINPDALSQGILLELGRIWRISPDICVDFHGARDSSRKYSPLCQVSAKHFFCWSFIYWETELSASTCSWLRLN